MNDNYSIARDLITNGYAVFQMPALRLHINDVFQMFKQLFGEDDAFKEKWKFFFPELSKKPDHGLIPPKGDGFDAKWFLHFRKGLPSMLLDRLNQSEYERYESMLEQIAAVKDLLHAKTTFILKEVDATLKTTLAQQVATTNEELHVIRLLNYLYQAGTAASENTHMAQGHIDQSAITLQWYQSHPGLVLVDYHGNKVPYNYEPGKVICFWGDKVERATDEKLKAVKHWVDARAQEDRQAGIYFVHTAHPSVERDNKHGTV